MTNPRLTRKSTRVVLEGRVSSAPLALVMGGPGNYGPYADVKDKALQYSAYCSLYSVFCKTGEAAKKQDSFHLASEAVVVKALYPLLKIIEGENPESREIMRAAKHLRRTYPKLFKYLDRKTQDD